MTAEDGGVPDEPARRGSDDGRAVGSVAEAIARAAHPGGEAGLRTRLLDTTGGVGIAKKI
jgi:hypothetical protein